MIEPSKCRVCGEQYQTTDNFCHNCGTAIHQRDEDSPAGDPWAGAETVASAELSGARSPISRGRRTPTSTVHTVACRSDIGTTHRVNQDAGGAWTWTRSDGTPVSFVVVADGVSAGRRSEDASSMAVDLLHRKMVGLLMESAVRIGDVAVALLAASRDVNHRVAQRPHESLSSADATTLVAACVIGNEGVGVWCGDSRCYRLNRRGATRLTRDHSWAEQVVVKGVMTEEDAARDPRAHMITRWLGPPDQEDPGLEEFKFQLGSGEVLLCCTDGLYGYFSPTSDSSEDEIARVMLAHAPDLQRGVEALVQLALKRGGRDNITVAAIRA